MLSNTPRNSDAFDHLVPQFRFDVEALADPEKEMNLWRTAKTTITVSL